MQRCSRQGGHLAALQHCLVASLVGSTAHGGHCSEHDRPSALFQGMQLGWGQCKLCSLARIARLRSSMASSKRVPVSRRPFGCLRSTGRQPFPVSCTQSEVQSTRPSYWRYYPTLIWSQSRAAITSPPPKGSPATFNFARFQTSKTSYLKLILSLTPLVLPSRAVATLELSFSSSSSRGHSPFRFFVPRLLPLPSPLYPILPPPPATPSTSLIFLILNHDHGYLHIQVVSFALSLLR